MINLYKVFRIRIYIFFKHSLKKYIRKIKNIINENIFNKKYERFGYCLGCGKCCSQIYVRHSKAVIQTEEEFEKLRYAHRFYSYLNVIGKDEIGLIFECTNLDQMTKRCKIHKKRPPICRKYPSEEIFMMGGILAENCGYSFKAIRSFEEVMTKVSKKLK